MDHPSKMMWCAVKTKHVFRGREADQAHAEERAAVEIEGRGRLLRDQSLRAVRRGLLVESALRSSRSSGSGMCSRDVYGIAVFEDG